MATVDTLSLAGKVAIITGSGRENGIGAGIALAFARNGAKVAINYISDSTAPRAAKVVEKLEAFGGKGSAVAVQVDVSTVEGCQKLVDEALKGLGVDHIDILVNNAVFAVPSETLATKPEDLLRTFQVNVFGPLYLMQAAVPHMPRGGRIVNIGSIDSKLGIEQLGIYGATKAAMDALSFCMSKELGRGKGITINTVAPGLVHTDMVNPAENPGAAIMTQLLVGMTRAEERPGKVEDIADAVLLVASEKSRWITGQFISVSGGITGPWEVGLPT